MITAAVVRSLLISQRSWWASGLEMTAIGLVEGIITYVIGIGLGKMGGAVG